MKDFPRLGEITTFPNGQFSTTTIKSQDLQRKRKTWSIKKKENKVSEVTPKGIRFTRQRL